MRLRTPVLTLATFGVAALLAVLLALVLADALQSRSARHVNRALILADLTWASADADGLLVTLTGTAPTEVQRFRAATTAGGVIGASRIIDAMAVEPARALTPPRFSLELLRNDDGISMIGLVPTAWDSADLLTAAADLATERGLTDMIETADFPVPDEWEAAIDFGMAALRLLPRSKISVAVDAVRISAIADSPEEKQRFDRALNRQIPETVPVAIQISAPRPMIAPFTLRFVIDEDGPRFDACAADSERSRSRIAIAGHKAGVTMAPDCVLGLGAPSPRWPDAAEAVIAALAELEAGSVTISDVDITLIADATVPQDRFDRVVGELGARLPDVFSLQARLTPPPQGVEAGGPARFTAVLSAANGAQLRGRLTDARMRSAVAAFARARFGADAVQVAARLDESLPTDWGVRVLAALAGLAELHEGIVEVEPERLAIRGQTGNPQARATISRILSDQLGQGKSFTVNVTYVERLDPDRALPGPQECLARASAVLEAHQITFAPGSAAVEGQAAAVVAEIADALEDCHGIALEIGGHTDSQGRAETNLRLSRERAIAVLEALTARGVDTAAMTAHGYGAAEPIADNATEVGRIANRRIALRLLASGDPAAAESDRANGDAGDAEANPSLEPIPPPVDTPPPRRPDDLVVPDEALTPVTDAPAKVTTSTAGEPRGAQASRAPGADDDAATGTDQASGEEIQAEMDAEVMVDAGASTGGTGRVEAEPAEVATPDAADDGDVGSESDAVEPHAATNQPGDSATDNMDDDTDQPDVATDDDPAQSAEPAANAATVDGAVDASTADWQPLADAPTLRPQFRPEEAAP